MNRVLKEVRVAACEAPRIYFAPLVGAVKEMRRQMYLLAQAWNLAPKRKNITTVQRHPA